MQWDEAELYLPMDLAALWQEVQAGTRKLKLNQVLDNLPKFHELPVKPADNNFRLQGKGGHDSLLKSYQQTTLHVLRMMTTAYIQDDESTAQAPFLMAWQLLSELYNRIQNDRKEASIPGSTPSSSTQLFGKDELQNASMVQRVNQAGSFPQRFSKGKSYRFRAYGRYISPIFSSTKMVFPFRFGYGGRGYKGGYHQGGGYKGYSQGGFNAGKGAKGKSMFTAHQPSESSTIPLQIDSKAGLVGAACSTTHLQPTHQWCVPRLARTRSKSLSLSQTSGGTIGSPGSNAGIHRSGSCPPSLPSGHKISHSLVSSQEAGAGGSQDKAHCRLPHPEPAFSNHSIQIRPLGGNISILKKKHVGMQSGLKACLFSLGKFRPVTSIHENKHWRKNFPISGSSFWPQCPPSTFHVPHESFAKSMEKRRFDGICLFGRHLNFGYHPTANSKTFGIHLGNIKKFRVNREHQKINFTTRTRVGSLGISHQFKARTSFSTQGKTKNDPERIGKNCNPLLYDPKEDGSNFRNREEFFGGNALSPGFYGSNDKICRPVKKVELGPSHSGTPHFKEGTFGNKNPPYGLGRKEISRSNSSQRTSFRFLPPRLGWVGLNGIKFHPRILENPRSFSHKCQGTFSGGTHHKKLCISKGKGFNICGQQCGLFIPKKGGRQENEFKSIDARPLVLVHETQNSGGDHLGKISGVQSRLIKSNAIGFGGLYPKPSYFQAPSFSISESHQTHLGHVCLPGKSPTTKICLPLAPLASFSGRCPKLSSRQGPLLLCQPPLDSNRQVAPKTLGAPSHHLLNDNSILGFSTVVAPFTKVKSSQNTGGPSTTLSRLFHKLPGDPNATNSVAPSLHHLIRSMLEKQQMSAESITLYLEKLPSLVRYQNAFNYFWSLCVNNKVDFQNASLWTIAGELLKMHKQLPHQARNAYSALLLLPGFDQLRFSSILKPCRREWNTSTPKYSTFYSASPFCKNCKIPL